MTTEQRLSEAYVIRRDRDRWKALTWLWIFTYMAYTLWSPEAGHWLCGVAVVCHLGTLIRMTTLAWRCENQDVLWESTREADDRRFIERLRGVLKGAGQPVP